MAIAKGLGSGFPIGACLATAEAAKGIVPGTHGSTFGGNPLAAACANAVLDVVLEDGFLDHVVEMGKLVESELNGVASRFPGATNTVQQLQFAAISVIDGEHPQAVGSPKSVSSKGMEPVILLPLVT